MTTSPEHLLAMELLSARSYKDSEDIRFLCGLLGIGTIEDAMAIALELYPEAKFTARTRFILDEIFGHVKQKPPVGGAGTPETPVDPPTGSLE